MLKFEHFWTMLKFKKCWNSINVKIWKMLKNNMFSTFFGVVKNVGTKKFWTKKIKKKREKEKKNFIAHQQIVKIWFDKHKAKEKNFEVGDLVLKWDRENESKGKHSKFQNLWVRPFQVVKKIGVDTY